MTTLLAKLRKPSRVLLDRVPRLHLAPSRERDVAHTLAYKTKRIRSLKTRDQLSIRCLIIA